MTPESPAHPPSAHDTVAGRIFPLARHQWRQRQIAAVLGGVCLVVLPWIVVFATTSRRQLPPIIGGLASYTMMMTVTGVTGLKRLSCQWRNARVIVSASGVVHEHGEQRDAVRWDAVTGIEVRRDAEGNPIQIELQRQYERPLRLRGFEDMPALAAALESHRPPAAR